MPDEKDPKAIESVTVIVPVENLDIEIDRETDVTIQNITINITNECPTDEYGGAKDRSTDYDSLDPPGAPADYW